MARDVVSIAEEEQDLDDADRQLVNQDTTAIEVVNVGDDLSWGAACNDGNGVDAGGNDTDIYIE